MKRVFIFICDIYVSYQAQPGFLRFVKYRITDHNKFMIYSLNKEWQHIIFTLQIEIRHNGRPCTILLHPLLY